MNRAYGGTIRKLQRAINSKLSDNNKICICRQQIYSDKYKSMMDIVQIKQYMPNPKTGVPKQVLLYQTPSDIQICLFLRDLWFELNDWELPTDNEMWNDVRARYQLKQYNTTGTETNFISDQKAGE